MTQLLADLSSIQNSKLVGGKAANLAKMMGAGIPVPPFAVIPADRFQDSLKTIWKELIAIHDSIHFDNPQEIEDKATQIREKVLNLKVNSELTRECEQWALKQKETLGLSYFAVRSSGLNEDSSSDSFAGQFSSFLFVPAEEIVPRILECWASAFNARALAYIYARKIGLEKHQMAVVVQSMIDARSSGVLFTENPDGHLNEMVVSAAYGLGEGVVADLVDTDLYRFDRHSKTIDKILDQKKQAVRLDPITKKNTSLIDVPESLQGQPCLNDQSINDLIEIAKRVEILYQHPQDIEWAQDEKERFFIVQCRPITTLAGGKKYLIDNANVSESYPGISSPMTHEFVKRCYEILFRSASLRVGAPAEQVHSQSQVYEELIHDVQGRLYYNLSNWYTMFKTVPGSAKYIEVWEEMMGLEAEPAKYFNLSQLRAFNTFRLLIKNYLNLQKEMNSARARIANIFDSFYSEFTHQNKSALMLSKKQEEMEAILGAGWDITLLNDGYTFIFAGLSKAVLKKVGASDPGALFNDLLAGEASMESARAVQSTSAMLDYLRAHPDLVKRLKDLSVGAITTDPAFSKMWQEHLMAFGDRCFEELKLESKSFRVAPVKLLELLLGYIEHDTDLRRLVDSDEKRREAAELELEKLFKESKLLRKVFSFTLARARQCMINRENSRLDRARMFGVIRTIAIQMGEHIKSQAPDFFVDDIFYLSFSEFKAFANAEKSVNDLRDIIAKRKLEWEGYSKTEPENRLWIYAQDQNPPIAQKRAVTASMRDQNVFTGIGSSAGIAVGEALVLLVADVNSPSKDKILVAPMTDPGWVFLMVKAKGLVSERGSILSHTAIIGRELGIPTVVNVKEVTRIIKSGEKIEINGTQGTVRRIQ